MTSSTKMMVILHYYIYNNLRTHYDGRRFFFRYTWSFFEATSSTSPEGQKGQEPRPASHQLFLKSFLLILKRDVTGTLSGS